MFWVKFIIHQKVLYDIFLWKSCKVVYSYYQDLKEQTGTCFFLHYIRWRTVVSKAGTFRIYARCSVGNSAAGTVFRPWNLWIWQKLYNTDSRCRSSACHYSQYTDPLSAGSYHEILHADSGSSVYRNPRNQQPYRCLHYLYSGTCIQKSAKQNPVSTAIPGPCHYRRCDCRSAWRISLTSLTCTTDSDAWISARRIRS